MHSPQQIAFNEVGRQAIMADPQWKDQRRACGDKVQVTNDKLLREFVTLALDCSGRVRSIETTLRGRPSLPWERPFYALAMSLHSSFP